MNIRWRLTIWYTAILTLILLVFTGAVYLGVSRSLVATLDNHLQREAGRLMGGLKFEREAEDEEGEDKGEEKGEVPQPELTYRPEEGILWRVLDHRGRPLVDPGYLAGLPVDPALGGSDYVRLENAILPNNIPIRLYSIPFVIEGQGPGVIQVAESYAHFQEVEQLLLGMLAIGLPFTLAVAAGGWFLASCALNPIDRITRTAHQISADDLHQRLNLKLPNDEVGWLAVTFDQMLARLEEAFERQKRFIADASHELRTPLTILKGDVEVALNRPRSAAEYRETLEMVNQTADRLTSLVEELFFLAHADNNQFPLQVEPFNLAELLSQQAAQLMPRTTGKNITLTLDIPETLNIVADPAKVSRLFLNLMDNAIKYSRPGDAVTVKAVRQNGKICISVTDTGPGIAPEYLPDLFERFYQVDKARSRHESDHGASSSGAGLGLAIADWLAKAHGGRIEVASQVGQGTVFTVWLPLETENQVKQD